MKLSDLKLPFPAEEIEWRIGQSGKNARGVWAKVLAYVSARAIMNRLDDVCGPENWKATYTMMPGSDRMESGVLCQLAIRIGDEWVVKEDGAEQTDIESFKGGISSALKRAGSVWGIGRYLYGLEEGFAQVSVEKVPGSRYATLKDGTQFYWEPPRLPDWALPTPKLGTTPAAPKFPGPITMMQPGNNDGVDKNGTGTFIKYGRFAGQWLNQIDPSLLREWIQEEEVKSQKSGKDLTPWTKKIIGEAEQIIAAWENEAGNG